MAVPPVDVPPVLPPLPPVPLVPESAPEEPALPEAEPEEPVRSPLDPDPSEPPGGFPAFPALPLDPEPVEEVVPPPFVPPLPDVPPLPRVPLPDVPVPSRRCRRGEAPPAAPGPYEPRPDETMVARPEPREELVLVHDDQRTVIEGPVAADRARARLRHRPGRSQRLAQARRDPQARTRWWSWSTWIRRTARS